jgi:chemotaxis protein MotB
MAEPEVHELVIIKHRRDHDEDVHHGGVWKIAYADFMTAMMAFFLVLWLLNSTNKEARISILNYFNPMKLADASMTRKGIADQKKSQPAGAPDVDRKSQSENQSDKPGDLALFAPSIASDDKVPLPANELKQAEKAKASAAGKEQDGASSANLKSPSYTEGALFKDPYRILGEIAGLAPMPAMPQPATGQAADQPSVTIGQGGNAAANYRDPFESVSPKLSVQQPAPPAPVAATRASKQDLVKPEPTKPEPTKTEPTKSESTKSESTKSESSKPELAEPPQALQPLQAAQAEQIPPAQLAVPAQPVAQAPQVAVPTGATAPGKQGKALTQDDTAAAAPTDATKLKAEMAKALADVMGGQPSPQIDVQATSEGVLISLTDEFDFGMFAIGSAEPQAKLVKIMDKIAPLLKSRPGPIVIRGHTDGRAYKSQSYDNWHLSSDRAQMARYMLVRGGLEEKRFEAVEGYADRRLKVPGDPSAAENRRIEILLRKDKT